MSGDALVGFRDPYGVRPLCLGDYEGHPVISSETSGLDIIGADFVREIQPGEIVIADSEHGMRSERVELEGARPALCIFEFIYFARPDSVMNGKTLHVVRQNMGRHCHGSAVEADCRPCAGQGMPGDRLRRASGILHRGPHQEPLRAPHLHPARPTCARSASA
jgi:glutamine phosphoribosylpyrophosphate amidotransferase